MTMIMWYRIGWGYVRVFGHYGPSKKEQTHLWAPYSCSRWITSADDNRGFTAEPFLADLVLAVWPWLLAIGDILL
jgi:hypothetical protein